LPVARGILSTLYVWFAEPHTAEEVESLYRCVLCGPADGAHLAGRKAAGAAARGNTNFCDIGFALDPAGRRLAVVSCLDNLGKGAAGQAVQNMNLMMGIEEATGLR
jgi:N-acetyl-gamma-glutamyl-phosphate reductase